MTERYFFLGDIHGSFTPIWNLVQRIGEDELKKTTNYLILLGDVGLNYYGGCRDNNFKAKLSQFPFTYFCIRGNHERRPSEYLDSPSWKTETFWDGEVIVEDKYPYIKYALDTVSTYVISGLNAIVIPGAYSVDKYYRLMKGWAWFPTEQLSEEEMEAGKKLIEETVNNKCDIVLSHTCPAIYEPTDLFLSQIDQSMVDKTMERYLGSIEYTLDYKFWLWGHYHKFRAYPVTEDKRERYMLYNDIALEYVDGKMVQI